MNAQRALLAQLIAKLGPARASIVDAKSTAWASVTFAGERHQFTLLVEGEAAEHAATELRRTISCAEFAISGHLVADIVVANMNVDPLGVRLDIEALTVIDD